MLFNRSFFGKVGGIGSLVKSWYVCCGDTVELKTHDETKQASYTAEPYKRTIRYLLCPNLVENPAITGRSLDVITCRLLIGLLQMWVR